MKKYILKRILLSLIVIFGVVTITFIIARVLPSDPASKWAGTRATPEQIEQARQELGLDDPLIVQYGHYISDLLHGDLGKSLTNKRPVIKELKQYIPATLELVSERCPGIGFLSRGSGKSGCFPTWKHPRGHVWNVVETEPRDNCRLICLILAS